MSAPRYPWERPLGARPLDSQRAEFRVWAPHAEAVAVRVGGSDPLSMQAAGYGVHETVAPALAGDDYAFLVDGQGFRILARAGSPTGCAAPRACTLPYFPAASRGALRPSW